MDLRLTINEVSEEYGRLRPHYPDALSSDLIAYSLLDATKKALEIGIGAGQATLPVRWYQVRFRKLQAVRLEKAQWQGSSGRGM